MAVKRMSDIMPVKLETLKVRPLYPHLFPQGAYKKLIYHFIGNPGTGKTVALAQIASQISREEPLLWINTETSEWMVREVLDRARAKLENVMLLDFGQYRPELGVAVGNIKEFEGRYVFIDSITAFAEYEEMKIRRIVDAIFRVIRARKMTAFVISQKRSSHNDPVEAAGGYAVSHLADVNIVLEKELINKMSSRSLKEKFGEGKLVRMIWVDSSKLGGAVPTVKFFEIREAPLGIDIKEG